MEPFRGVLNLIAAAVIWVLLVIVTAGVALVGLLGWAFFVFAGAERRLSEASSKISQTLMPGEVLSTLAVQLRPYALWSRRRSIGMTDSRIIIISRGLLGGFTMRDKRPPAPPRSHSHAPALRPAHAPTASASACRH